MGQLGFFDVDKRLTALSAKGDPLEAIDRLVPWESFRADIEMVALTPDEARKSNAGRKPFDAILMLRMLVLQSLYNLADEQVEYQVRDRLSFTRFLRLGIEDGIPDGTTLWLFREKLAKAGLIEKLFDRFDHYLGAHGYIARGGQIVDATIVAVPRQRNTRAESDAVKRGETSAAWKKKPAKNRQKDKDARWTKKHGKSFYGYKNHVNADAKHKLIRRYAVSDAAVHDSQELDRAARPRRRLVDQRLLGLLDHLAIGVAKIFSASACNSSPEIGSMTSPIRCASARNSGSRMVAMNAWRSATTRSAGTPGGSM